MDNLTSLLKVYGTAAPNDEVKSKILELIQVWASGTEGRSDASYIGDIYRALQREGFRFPPKVEMASTMLESSAVRVATQVNMVTGLTWDIATWMDRLGRLHAMPDGFQLYESKAPLPELRECL